MLCLKCNTPSLQSTQYHNRIYSRENHTSPTIRGNNPIPNQTKIYPAYVHFPSCFAHPIILNYTLQRESREDQGNAVLAPRLPDLQSPSPPNQTLQRTAATFFTQKLTHTRTEGQTRKKRLSRSKLFIAVYVFPV